MKATSRARLLFIWAVATGVLWLLLSTVGIDDTPQWFTLVVAALVGCAAVAYHEKFYGIDAMTEWLLDGSTHYIRLRVRAAFRWSSGVDRECAEVACAYVDTLDYNWPEVLDRLDGVTLDGASDEQKRVFGLFAAYSRYSALLFSERIDEAREVFDSDIMPHTGTAGEGDPGRLPLLARSCVGELLYCEGEHVRAWDALYTSLQQPRLSRFARARGLYFAGRIVLDRGQKQLAWKHFRAAIDTAPDTFVPLAIEALARELTKSASSTT